MPKAGSAAAKTRAPARWRMGTAPDDGSSAAAASIVTRAASRSAKDAAVARTLLVALRERRSAIEQAFYEMGKLLVKLKAPKMWAALGYTGFDAMIEGEDVVERTTAYELIEIVQTYPAKLAVAAGRTKATAVLRACGGDAVKARKALESGTLYGRSLDGLAAKRILGLRAAARAATAARKSPALRAAKDDATRIAAWLRDGGAHGATCTAELDDDGAAWIVVRARAEALGPLARPKRR